MKTWTADCQLNYIQPRCGDLHNDALDSYFPRINSRKSSTALASRWIRRKAPCQPLFSGVRHAGNTAERT